MERSALPLFAAGLMGLGILGLIYGDFALVWQPVPEWIPGRTALAYAAGVVMLMCGMGLLVPAARKISVLVLLPYLKLWFLLKIPALIAAPTMEAVWLGIGELAVLVAGGWVLYIRFGGISKKWLMGLAGGENGIRVARILFGVALIPIGLSHLVYVKETTALVPAWLPARVFWAYLTGAGQMACGAGIVLGIVPQVAAFAEAAMLTLFTLLVWGPAILAAPRARLPWTAFFISWVIAGAAWVIAGDWGTERAEAQVSARSTSAVSPSPG